MTLLQLKYFLALANNLHYTKTAQELHISQPSLSYAISELEKELGVRLFEKENKKVFLTVYGQHFLPYVEKSLSMLQEGKQVLNQVAGAAEKVVNLGYFHSISASFVPSVIQHFYQDEANQSIRFRFSEEPSYDICSKIIDGKLDFGFTLHPSDRLQSIPVMRQSLYLAVPAGHPLADRTSVSFKDFCDEPMIMLERSSKLYEQIAQLFQRQNVIPNVRFEVRECNSALQYVGMNFGVSILPMVPAMDNDNIAVIPISDQDKEFIRTVLFAWPFSRPLSPAARSVVDFIVKNYAIQ